MIFVYDNVWIMKLYLRMLAAANKASATICGSNVSHFSRGMNAEEGS